MWYHHEPRVAEAVSLSTADVVSAGPRIIELTVVSANRFRFLQKNAASIVIIRRQKHDEENPDDTHVSSVER